MYCRNCGNEVNEKAVACPKCGFNPRAEKKFCPSCGVATDPKQVICIKCGVSLAGKPFSIDTANLPKVDVQSFLKNKASVLAAIGIIACFLPWITVEMYYSNSLSLFGLSKVADYAPGTILVPFFLLLFPLSLLGFILSDYIQQISHYKKIFSIAALALLAYSALGLILAANPSAPEMSKEMEELGENAGEFGAIANQAMEMANEAVKDVISIGWGFYVAVLCAAASAYFYFKKN